VEPVGISQMMQGKVKEGLFVGLSVGVVVSEHQHLVSLINFKAVWQPQCTLAILAYWFIRGPSACALYKH